MNKNYRELFNRVQERSNPENIELRKSIREELSTISYSDILLYIKSAMTAVEPKYTERSKEAGENVKNHLKEVLSNVTYKFQGSVMTNTHIKGHSDIDLLTICEKFYSYSHKDAEEVSNNPFKYRNRLGDKNIQKIKTEYQKSKYSGNSLQDLKKIRSDSETKLSEVYNDCNVNHPKAIQILNKNLNQEVDIVTSNWYDDIISIINDKGVYRGIQIYNKAKHKKGNPDYPFLTITRINDKSANTNGRLKRMIRFLKNVKADSDHEIELSSFDIKAICYAINTDDYKDLKFHQLVTILYNQIFKICNDPAYRDNLKSVDGREYIFKGNQEKIQDLQHILDEIEGIKSDLNKNGVS